MIKQKIINSKTSRFSVKARFKSFVYAWEGIVHFLRTEHNAQVHLAASVLVIVLSVTLRVHKMEVLAVAFSMGLVWITEMINTSIEKIMDFISFEKQEPIKRIKDVAAGAVLVAAIVALFIGCVVFIPKMIAL